MISIVKTLCLVLLTTQLVVSQLFCGSRCFRMRDVSVMTFYQNQYATNSAGGQLPQIYCEKGNACNLVDKVKSVQCFNKGVDMSGKVNWKCESNIIGDDFTVDYTNPTCEGWSSQYDNDYAHSNSCICMVKLSLKSPSSNSQYVPPPQTTTNSSSTGESIFFGFVLFCIAIAFAVSSCCGKNKFSGSTSQVNNYVSSVASLASSTLQSGSSSSGLRHRNPPSQQQTVVSHGTSNNSAYPVAPAPVPQQSHSTHQVQQAVISHGTSNNGAYPSVQNSNAYTTQSVTHVQQTVTSHGTSNNSAYPAGNPSTGQNSNQQNQTQHTVQSHGTSNNSAYPVFP